MKLSLAIFLLFTSSVHATSLYQCKDENGRTSFQDKPCKGETIKIGETKSESIYGSWTGKSKGLNSYTVIGEEPPERIKRRRNLRPSYERDVDLTLSQDDCKIVFDLSFDEPIDCLYKPDKDVIIIPLWRNKDSIFDSGLIITKVNTNTLKLENQFTRMFTDNFEYKYQMKGTESYVLRKKN